MNSIYDPIEAVNHPGFYLIPGYSNYVISKDGRLFNCTSGRYLNGSKSNNYLKPNAIGYRIVSMIDDFNISRAIPIHRLLCLVFKYPGICFINLEVNHINGIKNDNRLENLEWVTTQQNARHAHDNNLVKRTKTSHPLSVRDIDTGEVVKYSNINICARDLGLSIEMVKYRYYAGEDRIFPERKQYRNSLSDDPWYIPENIDRELLRYGNYKSILLRNVITNEVSIFNRAGDLAKELNVSASVVANWLNKKDQPVLPGFFQIKEAVDDTPWRDVDDPYLELAETGRCLIRKYNINTGKETVYMTAVECARDSSILTTTLNWRLKSDKDTVYSDGCTYNYYNEKRNSRVPLASDG